ncbi:MAG: hypothetical protein HYZ53_03220 [Planctomycetes bacterium]|nr:hypothetical protein [Planctomycetota bacterium]
MVVGWIVAVWHDYQNPLAPTDHGWNLYVFDRVAQGDMPIRDVAWRYGPLMPYVYGGAMWLFGRSILTVLCVNYAFLAAATLLAWPLFRKVLSPVAAFAAAVLLLHAGMPFHTWNHIGGTLLLVASLLVLFRRLGSEGVWRRWLVGLLGLQALESLVLPTMAAASCFALCLALLTDRFLALRERGARTAREFAGMLVEPVALGLGWLSLTALLYLPFIVGVPDRHLHHALLGAGDFEAFANPLAGIVRFPVALLSGLFAGPERGDWWMVFERKPVLAFLFGLGLLAGIADLLATLLRKGAVGAVGAEAARIAASRRAAFTFVAAACSHQYLFIGAVQGLQWFAAVGFLPLAAWGVEVACRAAARVVGVGERVRSRGEAWGAVALVALCFVGLAVHDQVLPVVPVHREARLLHARGRVFTFPPENVRTFEQVAAWVERETDPGEEVASLPYAPLYNYLTGRKSPYWLVLPIGEGPLSPEDEAEIVGALETKRVRCVLRTNWVLQTADADPVLFGVNFGNGVAAYLDEKYEVAGCYGKNLVGGVEWLPSIHYVAGHQVQVLWRKGEPRGRRGGK